MTGLSLSSIVIASGLALILIGLWGAMQRKNIIRIIIGFALVDTGVNMVIVAVGYLTGRTAPIVDSTMTLAEAATRVVDPVPAALVLTAIVIGLGVTALMLSYAVRLHETRKSLSIETMTESKW